MKRKLVLFYFLIHLNSDGQRQQNEQSSPILTHLNSLNTKKRLSLIWPTFENVIVSHGQHANFLPESYLIDFIAIDCCFST